MIILQLLDFLLGKGHEAIFRRAELKTLVDLHGNEVTNNTDSFSTPGYFIISIIQVKTRISVHRLRIFHSFAIASFCSLGIHRLVKAEN